ncbi:hypothetical protein O0L34_g4242 [Tuta absoluta]|nr:hypothetical protein O0L34_g4242 [Tuta absoluta]
MIKSLDEKAGMLTKRISGTLKDRIKERRLHNVTGTLLYLHNHEVFCKLPADDGVFYKPSNEEIEEIICKTVQIEGLGLGVSEAEINTTESSASASLIPREQELIESQQLSFREKLDLELNRINKAGEDLVPRQLPETDVPSLVRVEMALFEDRGSRGRYLDTAYRRLLCIPPTSVESERAFSAVGILCNRIRSRLNDSTLDALLFLRSQFKS